LGLGELRLTSAQPLVGREAHADVAREGDGADDRARVIPHRRHRYRDVDPAPVPGQPLGIYLPDHLTLAHHRQQTPRSAATLRRHEHRD
jgi:hypothetical protein